MVVPLGHGSHFVRALPKRPPFHPVVRAWPEVGVDGEGNLRKGGNEEGKGEFAGGLGQGHAWFDSG